jgi:mannosyltransferase
MLGRVGRNLPLMAALLATLAVALWFRLNHLADRPFWLDEGYSAYGAEKGFAFIFHVLPGYETHPPFYTALLRCWTLITGTSILGFRSLGAVAGLLSLPLYWLVGREAARATGRNLSWTPLAVLALAAVLPSLVDWTRGVRPYPLIMLVFAAGIWGVLRVARGLREEGRIPNGPWCLYLLCQALFFWMHNLGSLYVAALGLGLLILCGPLVFLHRYKARFLLGHALVLLVALPAFLILLDQAPTWTSSTWLTFTPATVPDKLLALFGLTLISGAIFAPILLVLAFRGGLRTQAALLVMALVPVLTSLALSYAVAPVFLPRTLVACSVPLIILLGLGATGGKRIGAIVFLLLLAQTAMAEIAIQKFPPQEDWYGAVGWLKTRVRPGDRIYTYPNEGALPLHYALREKGLAVPVRPIPEAVPSHDPTGWYPTGSRGVVSLPQFRLDQIAGDGESKATPTIWLVRLGPGKYDAGDGFVRALSRGRTIIGHWPALRQGQPRGEPIDIVGLRRDRVISVH